MQAQLPASLAAGKGHVNIIGILQHCRQTKDPCEVQRLLAHLRLRHLDSHPLLGNSLVCLLAECGSLPDAQHVFDKLPHRDERSWTSLISRYSSSSQPRHAFDLYCKMQEENLVPPSRFTYVALLNTCARLKDPERGRAVHADVVRRALETEVFIGSTLVDMYGKFRSLEEARQVFDLLPVRDVVSWNVLIAGYVEHGLNKEVLHLFNRMQTEGVVVDDVTFVSCLKACSSLGALETGQKMHDIIIQKGFDRVLYSGSAMVGNTLLDMYGKHGWLEEARQVFDMLPLQNEVSWDALIAGYAEHGCSDEALACLKHMELAGVCANAVTYIFCLKASAATGALETGQTLHAKIVLRGLDMDLNVHSMLVDMYVKCSSLAEAHQVFMCLPVQDAVSWTALIRGYAEHDLGNEVLECLQQMQLEGVPMDAGTLVCSLKACNSFSMLETGREIHAKIVQKGWERDLINGNALVGNTLVHMYSKCDSHKEACHVFHRLPAKSVVSWDALIVGYADNGLFEEAVDCYKQMQVEGVPASATTFVLCLKACGTVKALEAGHEVHAEIIKKGLEGELIVGSTLVDMYSKSGSLAEAHKVFRRLPVQDAVSWTALVAGYSELGLYEEVLNCFKQMQLQGVCATSVTFLSTLKACGAVGAVETGQEIHSEVIHRGLERDIFLGSAVVGNTVLDMYCKCGCLAEACHVFDRLPVRNAVSWDALITGYAEQGYGNEVVNCFRQMQLEDVSGNIVTFILCLKACAGMGALATGRDIHSKIRQSGLEHDPFIGNMLIDMYGKCGSIVEGREVFDRLLVRDVVTWNAVLKMYSENHEGNMAVQCFEDMLRQGVKPDSVTFTSLLAACSHASLVQEGQKYFKLMTGEYEIEVTSDHCACMVDLFARSGLFYEAERFIAGLQCPPSSVMLMGLLTACRMYRKVDVAERSFQQLVELHEEDASAYLLMADIYASAGKWNDANKLEEMRKYLGAKKKPGSAVIEAQNEVHVFVVGAKHSEKISETIVAMSSQMKDQGYIPTLYLTLRQIDEEKEAFYAFVNKSLKSSIGQKNFASGERLCNDLTCEV